MALNRLKGYPFKGTEIFIVYEKQRNAMVDRLIEEGFIRSKEVEEAMRDVPRHLFVSRAYWDEAYQDAPLPTRNGQTTSAPSIVALMCEAVMPFSLVFEVGAGTGYLASVCAFAQKTSKILTTDLFRELVSEANKNFEALGVADRAVAVVADGSGGPFMRPAPDALIVSAAVPEIPQKLLNSLPEGGKMVIPVGEDVQELTLVKRIGGRTFYKDIIPCIFVPLLRPNGRLL